MSSELLIDMIITGIMLGGIYTLMAMGLTFVYGISKIFNYGLCQH